MHAAVRLQRNIDSHPAKRAADSIVDLFLHNVDDAATEELVLQRLRSYFTNALNPEGMALGSDDIQELQLQDLTAEQAVLGCVKLSPFLHRETGKFRRQRCAVVEVANDAVAELFCRTSVDWQSKKLCDFLQLTSEEHRMLLEKATHFWRQGIDCAYEARWSKPRYVRIRRSEVPWRQQRRRSTARMYELGVESVSLVDLDVREAKREVDVQGVRLTQPARTLWSSSVDSVRFNCNSPHAAEVVAGCAHVCL